MIPKRKRCAKRQEIDAAALETFERLRRVQLVARLRVAGWLSVVCIPLAAVTNAFVLTERLPQRMLGFASILTVSLLLLAVLRLPRARRNPAWLAVTYVACLTTCLLYLLSLAPRQLLDTLVAPLGALLLSTALLFPWGALWQSVLSVASTVAFTFIILELAPPTNPEAAYNLALGLLLMVTISIVTAGLLERHRFVSALHRSRTRALSIQHRRLMHIGRELRETLDPEALLNRIAQRARRLVPSDLVTIATQEDRGGALRLTAADGDPAVASILGIEVEPKVAADLYAALATRDLVEYPGGGVDGHLEDFMRSFGYTRYLCMAVGPRDRPAGLLAWQRREDRPFSALERLAAEGIADQAHTALVASGLYARALEAARLKSEFVSTVSHEFRTPLSVIIGYAEMSRDPDVPAREKARGLAGIETSARELLLLVEHTLDISRIESGQSSLDLGEVHLPTFFRDLAQLCAVLPRAVPVRLEWPRVVPDCGLHTDRRRLGIILRNLVSNALKFTDHGQVTISVEVEGSDLRVRVSDTGIGIRLEDQPVIFEIFRQADGSETRRYEGTGLGLYIVNQFTKQLGGEVGVESSPGRGSTFAVRIPGIVSGREAAATMPPEERLRRLRGRRGDGERERGSGTQAHLR